MAYFFKLLWFYFIVPFYHLLGPTQPPIQRVPGALFPEVTRPGREAEQSPPASAKVKNTWICTSILSYVFMEQDRDTFML
jgi:hypothetical protein